MCLAGTYQSNPAGTTCHSCEDQYTSEDAAIACFAPWTPFVNLPYKIEVVEGNPFKYDLQLNEVPSKAIFDL